MIYLKSLIRRFRGKTAFYASVPLLLVGLTLLEDKRDAFLIFFSSTVLLYALAKLINKIDHKKKTGVTCKLCGFTDCSLLYPARRKKVAEADLGSFACSSFDHAQYPDIYYCPECRNGFLDFLGKDDGNTKGEDGVQLYEEVEDKEYIRNLPARYLTNNKLVDEYSEYISGKDILEVGAYYGAFTKCVLGKAGSYTGIEPSKHACEYNKEKNPEAEIYQGTLEKAVETNAFGEKKFDTIILWDVIEHVPDPVRTLKLINGLLKEGGQVIFSTINIESSWCLLLGPFWPWFMDMHYWYFSDRGYVDMLHRSGFVMKEHKHFSYYVYFSYFVNKAMSMIMPKFKLPRDMDKALQRPIKITFGDTVAIVGTKTA
jgi:SAM-dependent methyltransferase